MIVGGHRCLCQETAEISFRAYPRENAPAFETLEPLINLEDSRLAHVATLELIARRPDLAGLYIRVGAWTAPSPPRGTRASAGASRSSATS